MGLKRWKGCENMCVALPGKVTDVDGDVAVVNFDGNEVRAHKGIVHINIGDYVLVHAGMIIQTLQKSEAESMVSLFKELEDIADA